MKESAELIRADRRWAQAWTDRPFRRNMLIALGATIVLLACLPGFFQVIEARGGRRVWEPLLRHIGPADVSVPVFAIIWGVVAIGIRRAVKSPDFLYRFLASYILLTLLRMLTIYVTRLDPPEGLIPLIDPIANRFYGKSFITRDLFFSGHTATLFLFAYNFRLSWERWLAAAGATAVGVLVLVQHVHYTVDVVAAPLLTYFCYFAVQKALFN